MGINKTNTPRWFQSVAPLLSATVLALFVLTTCAQEPPPLTPNTQPAPAATPAPTPAPTPIPVPEVVAQAEVVTAKLQAFEAELAADQTVNAVEAQLPTLSREVDARLADTTKLLDARPALETLRKLETDWRALNDKLPDWKRELTARATQIEQEITQLATLGSVWEQTRALGRSSQAPAELLARAGTIITAIEQTRAQLAEARARILRLQSRVSAEETRLNAALATVKQTREALVGRLLVRDSPPMWSASIRSQAWSALWRDTRQSAATQFTVLREYTVRRSDRVALHVALCLLFAAILYWARRRVRPWTAAEPELASPTTIFEFPVGTSLLLTVLLSAWIYPQAPRLLTALLGAAALAPAILILRRLVARPLYAILNALVIFYLIDRLWEVTQTLSLLARLVFLAEMLGGIVFLGWLVSSARFANVPATERDGLWRTIRLGARLALPLFTTALAANALGFTSLAQLIGGAVLGSAYVAVVFHVAVRALDGLVFFALRVRPLNLLAGVRNHRALLRRRLSKALRWLASVMWALITLDLLSLRDPLLGAFRTVLTAQLTVGTLSLSLGNVLAFLCTVWLAFLLSRFIRFILEEDVYPRVAVARGVPYAISTTLHYALLLLGFFLALGAFGFDLDKFTILAGAFGVGLGFGLQTIVSNFVSGLILLFERPVNVGDMIQMGEQNGELKRIGLRASVLRTFDGSEVILPNSKLISDEVINWTLSDQQRRLEIRVGVAYGTDPERVLEILLQVATAHPDTLSDPAPQALFINFGDNALEFILRVWTSHFERWVVMRSELMVAINKALREAQIAIPFPQRELHLQTLNPALEKLLRTASGSNGAGTNNPAGVAKEASARR